MRPRRQFILGAGIGRTPLIAAPALAARLGAGRLWLKLESAGPSGVHKDRGALAMVGEALARGAAGLTVGTCGNTGLALARLAREAGLAATVFIPARYPASAVAGELAALGATVVRTGGSYEDAVAASARHARAHVLYDANPTGDGGRASLDAYAAVAAEIRSALGRAPDSVWVPVGNGTTLAGVGRGFLALARSGEPPPRVCGAGSAGNTAAVASIRLGEVTELDPAGLRESPANEPLLNWRSAHASEALAVARATGGLAEELEDADLIAAAAALWSLEGVRAHPSAAASVAGLARALTGRRLMPGDHVAILTA